MRHIGGAPYKPRVHLLPHWVLHGPWELLVDSWWLIYIPLQILHKRYHPISQHRLELTLASIFLASWQSIAVNFSPRTVVQNSHWKHILFHNFQKHQSTKELIVLKFALKFACFLFAVQRETISSKSQPSFRCNTSKTIVQTLLATHQSKNKWITVSFSLQNKQD